jgi:hypothetical protein
MRNATVDDSSTSIYLVFKQMSKSCASRRSFALKLCLCLISCCVFSFGLQTKLAIVRPSPPVVSGKLFVEKSPVETTKYANAVKSTRLNFARLSYWVEGCEPNSQRLAASGQWLDLQHDRLHVSNSLAWVFADLPPPSSL